METEQSIVPTLQIISGPDTGRVYQLDRDLLVIGRNPDCDLVLAPKSVSRKHAAIVRRNAEYFLKDTNSTRGTFVNGQRLTQPVVLRNGFVIQIGELQLAFKVQAVQIQDGEEDQSTVFAAIDLSSPSDLTLTSVKPEEKLRAPSSDQPGLWQHPGPQGNPRKGPGHPVRDLSQGGAWVRAARGS